MEVVDSEPASPLQDLTRIETLRTNCAPEGPAHLGDPGFMRDQRIALLLFARRLTHTDSLQTYERVVVDLCFTRTRAAHGEPEETRPDEELYRGTVLNYEQVRISAFVSSAAEPAGSGYVEGIALAETNADVEFDATGPEIAISVHGQTVIASGDLVPASPVIAAPSPIRAWAMPPPL